MAVPFKPFFDRLAQLTFGFVAYGLGNQPQVNGVALVTGFEFAEIWNYCGDDPVTVWAACIATPSTTWTSSHSAPATVWTLRDGGTIA